MPFAGLPTR